ncbi:MULTISPECIES: collagen-like protein [Sporosarcina]|uniref:collagen-like protein n=1 Tax=Sporosarcina TaxID=1569 RepID=UPI0030D253D9
MSDDQFPVPHNPNNSELPFGQPHYPKNQEPVQFTKQGAAPTNPPPSSIPKQQTGPLSIDPGALRGCLYRDTYLSLVNRTSFWFHPTYIDYITTTGFKWDGYAWLPWRIDLDKIISFQCT